MDIVKLTGYTIAIAIFFLPLWRITKKTGYPGWWSIAFLFPIVNLVFLFYLAFSKWPVLKELERFKC